LKKLFYKNLHWLKTYVCRNLDVRKMRIFDYFLVASLGFVIGQATIIITLNTKWGIWGRTQKLHTMIVIIYPMYLGSVLYSSLQCDRCEKNCSTLWKVCSMFYIVVTVAVWLFYYARSKVVHSLTWDGKCQFERLASLTIVTMGGGGLCFLILSIEGAYEGAFLIGEKCHLAWRLWIQIVWMVGDAGISILLLLLFLRPLTEVRQVLRDHPRSTGMLNNVHRVIQKHRNLLIITVAVTLVVMVTITVTHFSMRTTHYLCTVERLVALQCITLTFNFEAQEYFYYRPCLPVCCGRKREVEEELSSSSDLPSAGRTIKSPSIIVLSPAPVSMHPHMSVDSICFELQNTWISSSSNK